ncbi:MAG: glutaredoxin family protein [Chloroflexota bacterium]|nr:glutaredoxin family protein [Chloroflexota bacterium]
MLSDSNKISRKRVPQAHFYTRAGCSLCERASRVLARLEREGYLTVERLDIAADPTLDEQYGMRIPVVELSTGYRFEGRISEYRLRKALTDSG